MQKVVLCIGSLMFALSCFGAAATGKVTVATSADHNKKLFIHYRVPDSYNVRRRESYRVLVFFGGVNEDPAIKIIHGKRGWGDWADRYGIFIVAPHYVDDDYWHPETWSGEALLAGLAEIKKQYNICTDKLFFYGYSAGARCANLFPAWKPNIARAYVSHGSGTFHAPNDVTKNISALITFGNADNTSFVDSLAFIAESQKIKANLIWRCYDEIGHLNVPGASEELARAFLIYQHQLSFADCGGRPIIKPPSFSQQFAGDGNTGKYYPANSTQVKKIAAESLVILPKELVETWAKGAD